MFWSISLSLVCSMLVYCTMAENMQEMEKRTLDKILARNLYDPNIRPYVNDTGPVTVRINTYIRSISEIDDVKMEYSAQLTFRMAWKDSRLQYNGSKELKYLTLTHPEKLWRPDVFFSNEKSGHFHNMLLPNVLMRIFPDGEILYSTRISMKLSCPMDLRAYPMDRQTCNIKMASYGYTTEHIVFLWKASDPVQMTTNLNLPRFTLDSFNTDYCTSRTNTGEYSCLVLNLLLSRELSYYLLQVYVPYVFLVILSWISFWLDYRATTARVAIWVTILLTMTIMTSSIQTKLPAVSYTKSIDIWTGTCLTFLFAVIIELALVTQAVVTEENQRHQANAALAAEDAMMKKPLMSIDDHGAGNTYDSSSKFAPLRRWLNRYPSRAQKIDIISRILFPLVFAFFNLVYWSSYAHGGRKEN